MIAPTSFGRENMTTPYYKPRLVVKNEPKAKGNNNQMATDDVIKESKEAKAAVQMMPNTVGTIDPASMASIVASAVAEALKVGIPAAAVGINQAQYQAAEKVREGQIREIMRRTKRCAVCGQQETACGGPWKKDSSGNDIVARGADGSLEYDWALNHDKAYVGPQDANLTKWNPGIRINGVLYKSDHFGQTVLIPKKSDILTQIAHWEQNEKELMQKRTAEGQGMVLGPGGSSRPQQAIGWR